MAGARIGTDHRALLTQPGFFPIEAESRHGPSGGLTKGSRNPGSPARDVLVPHRRGATFTCRQNLKSLRGTKKV